MRDIVFRAKRIDTGEWILGSLVYWPGDNKIGTIVHFDKGDEAGFVLGEHIEVDLSTVGQYTGLIDKHGTRIFEGDLVYNGVFLACVEFCDGRFYPFNGEDHIFFADECEVINNVHDNPNL